MVPCMLDYTGKILFHGYVIKPGDSSRSGTTCQILYLYCLEKKLSTIHSFSWKKKTLTVSLGTGFRTMVGQGNCKMKFQKLDSICCNLQLSQPWSEPGQPVESFKMMLTVILCVIYSSLSLIIKVQFSAQSLKDENDCKPDPFCIMKSTRT